MWHRGILEVFSENADILAGDSIMVAFLGWRLYWHLESFGQTVWMNQDPRAWGSIPTAGHV